MGFKKSMSRVKKTINRKIVKPYITGTPKRTRKARMNLYSEVAAIKKALNVEKKRVDVTQPATTFGQTNGVGVSGGSCLAITPVIAQGLTGATRNGNSLKLVSAMVNLYVNQSANAVNATRIRWTIFCKPDNNVNMTGATAYPLFYETNPFSSVIDYHSNRDPEYFTSFKIIKSGEIQLKQDNLAGGISFQQRKIPLRLNHHLKYNTDASTTTTKNQLYIVFTADQGDMAALTGAQFQYNIRYFYVDN